MLNRVEALIHRFRHSVIALPAALLFAVAMIGVNELSYRGAQSRLDRLVEMGQARMTLMLMLQRINEAESGKRGYLLTGGREYLDPYLQARQDVLAQLQALEKAYDRFGDADAAARRAKVAQLANAKLAEMEEVIRLYDSGKPDGALEVVRSGIGREVMVQLRTEAKELLGQQNGRIALGLSDIHDTLLLNRIGVTTMTLVALLALVMFVRLASQLDRQRLERQAEVAAERDRLERVVAHRTADLTELARHLQTAREDERAHLARELHDELGALLTAAKLDVARIKPKLQQGAPELLERLAHLTESLNAGIALKRRIIEDLRPSTLDSLGLCPALEILCADFKERSGVAVQADLEPVSLAPRADLTVFRLVQEALTNVAKYAKAAHVKVRLREVDGQAEVSVEDDGVGFDSVSTTPGSHGLMGMRFRVEAERGRFVLRSGKGQGTLIQAWLPLQPAAAEDGDAVPDSQAGAEASAG